MGLIYMIDYVDINTKKENLKEKDYQPAYIMRAYKAEGQDEDGCRIVKKRDFDALLDLSKYKKKAVISTLTNMGILKREEGFYHIRTEWSEEIPHLSISIDMAIYLAGTFQPPVVKLYCLLSEKEGQRVSSEEILSTLGFHNDSRMRNMLTMWVNTLSSSHIVEVEVPTKGRGNRWNIKKVSTEIPDNIKQDTCNDKERVIREAKERGLSDWDIEDILNSKTLFVFAAKGLWEGIGY